MNKRARNRLIGVTAIILVLAAVLLATLAPSGAAYERSVADVVGNASLVGTRVKVTGTVVSGSWDKKTNPMVFKIHEEGSTGGPEIKVIYNGGAPNTFGSDTVAILTGTLEENGVIQANEMITKCPSKYSTRSDAATVTDLLKSPSDAPIRVVGFLKPGSLAGADADERFVLASAAGGTGNEVPVAFESAMPAGTEDGAELIVFGKMESGVFVATEVALAK